MANEITAFNEEFWSAQMQTIFFKENVAYALANTTFREILHKGDYLNKPYRSHPQAVDYTKGTDITVKDRQGSNEQLNVATAKVVPFYVDKFKLSTLNFVNCWKLPLNILAKTEYLKGYIRTMLENNMVGTISSQA